MSGIRGKVNEIYSLEQLSIKNTIIHNIHPLIKMIVTVVYIVCILSVRRYDLLRFSYFLFYLIFNQLVVRFKGDSIYEKNQELRQTD